jgi:hypothetical protein
MKNKNLILLLAAGAAYWYFFMYKKKEALKIEQPGFTDQPGTSAPVQLELAPAITTESVTIVDEIRNFGEGNPQPQQNENIYQNYYVNQVSGVKRMGVPYTI